MLKAIDDLSLPALKKICQDEQIPYRKLKKKEIVQAIQESRINAAIKDGIDQLMKLQ